MTSVGKEMNIQELADSLPNGFHDALLHSHEVDYDARTATFTMDLWVGDIDSEKHREAYRLGQLIIKELDYLFIDPPDANYDQTSPHQIDLCDALPDYPQCGSDGSFRARFYSASTNAFIHFSGSAASFEYIDEKSKD